MTFSISLADSIEGQRLYARSRNRFAPLTPFFFGLMALLFGFGFWLKPDPVAGAFTLGAIGLVIYDGFWVPHERKRRFRQTLGGVESPPITYHFSEQGFTVSSSTGEASVAWTTVTKRLEGPHVWVFVLPIGEARHPDWRDGRKVQLLFVPKSATQTPEGAREWAVVDAHFARSVGPPIASPGS